MSVNATTEWRAEIAKQFRYPGHVRLDISVLPDIDQSVVSVNATNALDITTQRASLFESLPAVPQFATFEGIWKADGSMYLPSDQSDENLDTPVCSSKFVSSAEPMILNFSFGAPVSFAGITGVWDTVNRAWPTKLVVLGYDTHDQLTSEYTVSNVNETVSVLNVNMDDVVRVSIHILQWSRPGLLARVSQVVFGVLLSLTDTDVISISEETVVDPMNARLPFDSHTYRIRNQVYKSTEAPEYTGTDLPIILSTSLLAPIEFIYAEDERINYINFIWDVSENAWPTSARLECIDSSGTVVYERDFSASDVSTSFNDLNVLVQTVRLYVYHWSNPFAQVYIEHYDARFNYGNGNTPSEVNNFFDPTFRTGCAKYLTQRQKIQVQYGLEISDSEILWLPTQTRFLNAWSIPTDSVEVELQSSTRLAFMTNKFTKHQYTAETTSLRDLALTVLESSSIIKDSETAQPWQLPDHSALDDLESEAPLPVMAENALLQLIAGAAGMHLCTEPETGYVQFLEMSDQADYTVDESVQLQQPSTTISEPLRSVSVYDYTYTVDTEQSFLYRGKVSLQDAQTVTVEYEDGVCAANVTVMISGATARAVQVYSHHATLTLEDFGQDQEALITVKGYIVRSSKRLVTAYTNPAVSSGRDVVIDNPLITNGQSLSHVASCAVQHYSRRQTVETRYTGFPDLKAGDCVQWQSAYQVDRGTVLEHTLDYNGAYSGKVKVLLEDRS